MSQQELEQGDQEVIGMVNGHSHPDAVAAAEEIAESVTAPVQDRHDDACVYDAEDEKEQCGLAERLYRKRKQMEILRAVLFVAACLCIATALVAVLYVPKLLVWVVNIGVLACGIAGAVKIDKYIRWWR